MVTTVSSPTYPLATLYETALLEANSKFNQKIVYYGVSGAFYNFNGFARGIVEATNGVPQMISWGTYIGGNNPVPSYNFQ